MYTIQLITYLGETSMGFGSIRFYKVLILTVLALMIIIPTVLSVFLMAERHEMKKTLDIYNLQNAKALGIKSIENSIDYQKMFPDMYVDWDFKFADVNKDNVYLTFDDGPSNITSSILDILKEKEVKATFFVVYKDTNQARENLKRMSEEGHTISVHSYSHQYLVIYSAIEIFLADFEKTATWIEEVTGNKPEIFRFPGGSINNYNVEIYEPLISEMLRRGYVYYDWNVSSQDAGGGKSSTYIRDIVVKEVKELKDQKPSIVLFHDRQDNLDTLYALPDIIDRLKKLNRNILPLENTVKPIAFSYLDD